MWRIFLALLVIGGIVGFIGFQELQLANAADPEPAEVELKELEASPGADLENAHLKIGPHLAAWGNCVYEYEGNEGDQVTASTKLNHVYVPLASPESLANLATTNKMGTVAVLVKDKSIKTFGELPKEATSEESVQGLVINKIGKLGGEEENLVKQTVAALQGIKPEEVDTDKIYILEKGRKPQPATNAYLMLGGGGVLILLGLAGFALKRG